MYAVNHIVIKALEKVATRNYSQIEQEGTFFPIQPIN